MLTAHACSIATNRVWAVLLVIVLTPTYGGDNLAMLITTAGLSSWLGWTVPLLVTQWRLDRDYELSRALDNSYYSDVLIIPT